MTPEPLRPSTAAGRPAEVAALLEGMLEATVDAFVAIDSEGRVTDFSPSAARMFGWTAEEVVGRPMVDMIVPPAFRPFHERGMERYLATGAGRMMGQRNRLAAMRRDGTQFPVELALFEVPPGGRARFAAFIRDLSPMAAVEQALVESGQRFAEQARVLQRSLLSVTAVEIPGLEVAVRYRAGEEDMEVGGDFYDVFALPRGAWSIVVGDVEGKGLQSAAAMVLARFTVRQAAQRRSSPRSVVGALNEAIMAQDVRRLCTLAYARVTRAGSGFRLTVALAGHPRPLVSGPGGTRAVGRSGVALGVLPNPPVPEGTIDLRPGDVALFYSDGLTDSRSQAGDFLGERPVRELLAATREGDAECIAEAVASLSSKFQAGRANDDTTILVMKVPHEAR